MSWRGRARSVGVLSIGTLLGQLFVVGASPVLTRLYSPFAFGRGAVAASALAILSAVACCSADQMLHSSTDLRVRARLARTGMLTSRALATVVLVTALVVAARLGQEDGMIIAMVGVGVLATGSYAVGTQVAVLEGRFAAIASRDAVQGLTQATGQILLGVIHPAASSLIAAQAMSRTLASSRVSQGLKVLLHEHPITFRRALNLTRWTPLLIATGSIALTSISLQAPVVLTSIAFGSGAAGLVALSQRVLALPLAIVGQSIGQAFLHDVSRRRSRGTMGVVRLGRRYLYVLTVAGTVLAVSVAILGPWAFESVFGQPWRDAGVVARSGALAIGSQFVSSPLSVILVPLGAAAPLGLLVAARLILAILVFAISAHVGAGVVTAVFYYSCVQLTVNVLVVALAFRALRHVEQGRFESIPSDLPAN